MEWLLPLVSIGLTVWAVGHLLIYKRERASTITWLIFVLLVPVIGPVTFFLLGPQRLERRALRRKAELARKLEEVAPDKPLAKPTSAVSDFSDFEIEDRNVFRLTSRLSEYPITSGNNVEILPDPERTLAAMRAAIESAKHFVHLEYYIIASDEVTRQLFDSLKTVLRRGVEVRILYDSLGSLFLKRRTYRELVKLGAKTAGFLPFSKIFSRFNVNFRNHRKILIIDGKVAFTGGTNIGKEYLGRRNKGQWRDFSVRVTGPACLQLHDVFIKDWHFTTEEDLFGAKYYPPTLAEKNKSIVQVLESGPDSPFHILHQAIFLAMNSAQKRIYLTTPYFIPDSSIMTSLIVAALRGIDVKLLLPRKSDSALVRYASRSFYEPLLTAKVRIYEYQPQILHSKLMVIDDKWTMMGSANMDIRSFRLNFELNVFVYGKPVADQAHDLFSEDLAESQEILSEVFKRRFVGERILENSASLMSPIL